MGTGAGTANVEIGTRKADVKGGACRRGGVQGQYRDAYSGGYRIGYGGRQERRG